MILVLLGNVKVITAPKAGEEGSEGKALPATAHGYAQDDNDSSEKHIGDRAKIENICFLRSFMALL